MERVGELVFRKAQLCAHFFKAQDDGPRSDWVVVTFTERFNRDLDGPGFGTQFLLAQGFDVLAVKNAVDDWYAHFGADEIAALNAKLEPYPHRASYGSSMGGFAAIKFAKPLGIERSLSISPIQDIRYDWDTRHAVNIPALGDIQNVALGEMISREEISPHATHHIAFDPFCLEDARHAQILCQMTPRHAPFRMPWGGHPVGPAMRDAGILAAFVLNAINLNDTSKIQVKTPRTGKTLRNRAHYLLDRNKLESALVASTRAVDLLPEWEETCILHAQILHRLGRIEEAVPFGMRAVELEPSNPYIAAIVARILMDKGKGQEAGELVLAAIRRVGQHEALAGVLHDLGLQRSA